MRYFVRHCEVYGAANKFGQCFGKLFARFSHSCVVSASESHQPTPFKACTQRRRILECVGWLFWRCAESARIRRHEHARLSDEERICQTYPDSKGRVSTVKCSATGDGATRNIPVDFWGGVNRNAVSNWKCRREKSLLDDRFVCRAID